MKRLINKLFAWLGYYPPRAYRFYIKVKKDWVQVVASQKNIDARVYSESKSCAFDELLIYRTLEVKLEIEARDRVKEKDLISWYKIGDSDMPDLSGNGNHGILKHK